MANQITIDIGAAANDGTGDPLRTAFNYVNNNFSNVWNTGLPNSNVQFSDNRILTVNTNANLVLAPNGIGKVASNVDIVPNTANVFSLGGPTRRWNTVYAQYLDVSNDTTFGDLTVDGNLTVQGNTIQIGNIVTDTKTIQLANTASTTSAANGSGITVGASDNIATLLYNSTSNAWTTNIGVSVTGNVSGNYFIGNGALLTGLSATYGNSNVANFMANFGSNSIVTTGNISAGNVFVTNVITTHNINATTGTFTGDQYSDGAMYVGSPAGTVLGSDVVIQATANGGGYSQINFQNINSGGGASSDYILTADNGNDTTHYFDMGITSSGWDGSETNVLAGLTPNNGYLYVQDGNLTLGTRNGNTSYSWKFDTTGNLTVAGNVIPTGNNTQSLGSATRQWNDLYLSNATIFMNSVPISLNSSNVMTVNGSNVVTATAGGNIDVNNIVSSSNIAIDTSAEKVTVSVNLSNWVFDETGVLTAPGEIETVGNISAGYFLGNGSQLTGINTLTSSISNGTSNVNIAAANGNITINATGGNTWTFDNTGNLALPNNGSINFAAGGIVQAADEDFTILVQDADDDGFSVYLNVDDGAGTLLSQYQQQRDQYELGFPDAGVYYQFNDNGTVVLPANAGVWSDALSNVSIIARSVTDSSFVELMSQDNSDIKRSNVTVTRDNVTVTTSSGAYNWTFDVNGDLIVPGGNTVIYTANAVGNVAGNSISITGGAADQTDYYATPGGNINITGGLGAFNDGGGGGQGGSINITAGASADPAGVAGNINITAGSGTMVFDYGGNLTVSGSILTDNIRTIEGAVHVGQGAGLTNQGTYAIAMGRFAGGTDQGAAGLAIGQLAGASAQGISAIALGLYAAANTQSANAVAIGTYAGQITQGSDAIAIGQLAGNSTQGSLAVAIGSTAGANTQGGGAVAVGYDAGEYSQGNIATALGAEAGKFYQSTTATAVGTRAGNWNQGAGAVAIGKSAAENISNSGSQGLNAIAIGNTSGYLNQGASAIAIGAYSGLVSQGQYSIAIGDSAGRNSAGGQGIGNNSIILNATGANFAGTTANSFYVNPVRNDVANIGQVVFYNTTSKEVTYGNTISVTGNISTDGYIGAGNIGVSTTITTQTLVTDPGPLSGLTIAWGARGFISDGNLTAVGNFGAQVSGGGGNSVPVWSDGTNWYIG